MSIFDKIDEAHEAYIKRHREAEKLVDDVDPESRPCPCASCTGGWKHVHGCLEDQSDVH